jgi:hypothetical protein
MSSSRLPQDDDFLDEHEVEGLVSSPASSPTKRSINPIAGHRSNNKLFGVVKKICDSRKSRCWMFVLVLFALGVVMHTTHLTSIHDVEQFFSGKGSDQNEAAENKNIDSSKNQKNHGKGGNNSSKNNKKGNKGKHGGALKDWQMSNDDAVDDEKNKHSGKLHKGESKSGDNDQHQVADDDEKKTKDEEDSKSGNDNVLVIGDDGDDGDDEAKGTRDDTSENKIDNSDDGKGSDVGKDQGNDEGGGKETSEDGKYSDDYTTNVVIAEASEEDKEERVETLIEKWGKWHFWDGAAETRPTEDYLSMYPNNDCPYEGFPDESWQADAVYVNHMIDSALDLVDRAKEAIFTEYGLGKDSTTPDHHAIRSKMFKLNIVDFEKDDAMEKMEEGLKHGGWTTRPSFKGIVRRVLHAMMTNDKFTIVMAGDSAAAGRGNHFLQSYMAQFENIMKPIMERLGVELVTMNLANGDIGTMSNALGSGSIYGDNVDIIIWDADLTNGDDNLGIIDLFFRQALLAGKRPPVLIGSQDSYEILRSLNLNTDGKSMIYIYSRDIAFLLLT